MHVDRGEQSSSRLIALTRPLGRSGQAAGWTPINDLSRTTPEPATEPLPVAEQPVIQTAPRHPGNGRRRVSGTAAVAVIALAVMVALGVVVRGLLSDAGQRVDAPGTSIGRTTTTGWRPVRSASPATRSPAWSSGSVFDGGPSDLAGRLVVDVVGRVARPGLARLPAGARVADAIAAVGGVTSGAALSRVNLARRLVDGEQLVVPGLHDPLAGAGVVGADPGTGSASGGGDALAQPVDLNAATLAQLDGLPGVGPVTAGRILAWRGQHQRFSRVEELAEVPGIGPKMLERLRPLVRV